MDFENLDVWKKARNLTNAVYSVTKEGDFSKDYGLRDQIRRASVSVMSNIAEGYERDGNQEFMQFLSIAKGSSGEVRTQLYIALDQEYISTDTGGRLISDFRKLSVMLSNFIEHLKRSPYKGHKYKQPPRKSRQEEVEEIVRMAQKKNSSR